jgi:hypothetical protein
MCQATSRPATQIKFKGVYLRIACIELEQRVHLPAMLSTKIPNHFDLIAISIVSSRAYLPHSYVVGAYQICLSVLFAGEVSVG